MPVVECFRTIQQKITCYTGNCMFSLLWDISSAVWITTDSIEICPDKLLYKARYANNVRLASDTGFAACGKQYLSLSLICLEWTLRPSNWWIQLEKLLPAIFKFNRWFTIFEPLKFCRSCWMPQAELHPSTLDRFGRWPWTSGVAYNTPGWTVLYNRWYTVHLVLLLCETSHIQHCTGHL